MSNPRTETYKLGVEIRPPYRFPDTGHLPKTASAQTSRSLISKVGKLHVRHHQQFKDQWSLIFGTGDHSCRNTHSVVFWRLSDVDLQPIRMR